LPHGSIQVGDVRITALCDAVANFPRPLRRAFAAVPPERWAPYRSRYPDAFDASDPDRWRLHDHCYLVQERDRTTLVDTGVGPAGTPAATWLGTPGRLPEELAAVGAEPGDVDTVVLTHLHLDHIGWNVTMELGATRPTFPRARYVVQAADWALFATGGDANDREVFDLGVRPLEELGVLEQVDGERRLSPALTLLHTPGHTPGSQSLLISGGGERALLWGDVAIHPAQVTEPDWSATDMDRARASATRQALMDRAEQEGITVVPAHFPEPFGSLVRVDGRRYWSGRG
jgi:glyoxylase-like metal-dependent hydrolase (beta-lactamase superfamily II)